MKKTEGSITRILFCDACHAPTEHYCLFATQWEEEKQYRVIFHSSCNRCLIRKDKAQVTQHEVALQDWNALKLKPLYDPKDVRR